MTDDSLTYVQEDKRIHLTFPMVLQTHQQGVCKKNILHTYKEKYSKECRPLINLKNKSNSAGAVLEKPLKSLREWEPSWASGPCRVVRAGLGHQG